MSFYRYLLKIYDRLTKSRIFKFLMKEICRYFIMNFISKVDMQIPTSCDITYIIYAMMIFIVIMIPGKYFFFFKIKSKHLNTG